jgi:predicted lipid-binding transport protein (Tim44 family)
MDEFFDLPTIIVIGVAIVILFRLRSVLGTKTGNERQPVERKPEAAGKGDETVVQMRGRTADQPEMDDGRRARKVQAEIEQLSRGSLEVSAGLKAISELDTTFTPKSFLEGAKQAYEMIVTAFAAGDKATLKNLLEKDVYDGFEGVIKAREASGQKVDFTFVGLPKIEITDAEGDKRNVQVTIQFHAEVVSATRDKDGTLIEGNADQVQTIADEWTFARNPKSRDPNWKLVATQQLA